MTANWQVRSILCPVDFSPPSRVALRQAAAVAHRFGAEVLAVHVIEPIVYPVEYGMVSGVTLDLETTAAKNALDQLEAAVKADLDPGIRSRCKVTFGTPWRRVGEVAAEEKSDLIVLATHGRTGIPHLLLGSTAEKVVRSAPCPVLTIRVADDAPAAKA